MPISKLDLGESFDPLPSAPPSSPTITKLDTGATLDQPSAQPSPAGAFMTGFTDPLVGLGQLGAHLGISGDPLMMGPFGGEQPSVGEIDKAVSERERVYQAARQAAGKSGVDWTRMLGNVTNPLVYAIPAAGGEAGVIGTIARSALAGGGAAAMEPVGDGNFWSGKIRDIGIGSAFGGVLGPVGSMIGRGVGRVVQMIRERQAGPEVVAARAIERKLAANPSGPTAEDVYEALAKARQADIPLVAADVSPELRDLGGRVFRAPGTGRGIARDTLLGRQLGEGGQLSAQERVNRAIDQIWSGASAYRTERMLTEAQKAVARPLYERAEALNYIWSPRLQQFLEAPEVRQGLARGYQLERLAALEENRAFNPTQLGLELDADGNVKLISTPNLRVLDMGKRGLDAMIAAQRDQNGRLSALGRQLAGVRRAYVNEIDQLDTSGIYKQARAAWAGPAAAKDALEVGQKLFSHSPEEIREMMAGMGPAEREAVKIGVADMLRERLLKSGFGGDKSRAILRNPWMEQHIGALIPEAAARERFFTAITSEHTMAETAGKTMAGSQTAERLQQDLSPELRGAIAAMRGASHLARGNIPAAVWHWGRELVERARESNDPAVNEALARFLFDPSLGPNNPVARALMEPRAPPISLAPGRVAPFIGAAVGGETVPR